MESHFIYTQKALNTQKMKPLNNFTGNNVRRAKAIK